ncbi:hypothetical protein K431DRAFT_147595 [Polychaeton citri CBS 116435]|uniref:Uncharacterized protein n=1 Tax=Polychaeton citri CBS 116435 TaxID=1314669 RepID=A0A9P4Q1S1_9PEZI|nr:hypothetical protein K431DRAFT_147595 [Polychaeton citri CBS 116435]
MGEMYSFPQRCRRVSDNPRSCSGLMRAIASHCSNDWQLCQSLPRPTSSIAQSVQQSDAICFRVIGCVVCETTEAVRLRCGWFVVCTRRGSCYCRLSARCDAPPDRTSQICKIWPRDDVDPTGICGSRLFPSWKHTVAASCALIVARISSRKLDQIR